MSATFGVPLSVRRGLALLYAVLGVKIFFVVFTILLPHFGIVLFEQFFSMMRPEVMGTLGRPRGFVFSCLALFLFWGLIVMISRGRNWARWFYAVLFAYHFFVIFPMLRFFLHDFSLEGVVSLLVFFAQGLAVFFLFQNSSRAFFKGRL